MTYREQIEADIRARNAGRPTLVVWPDGSNSIMGARDAGYEEDDSDPLLLLDMETWQPIARA